MSKRTRFILIAVVVLIVAALVWAGSGALYRLLLALHGKH